MVGPLVRARPYVRIPGSTDAFETAVLVVLGQHVSLAAGRVFAARLVAAHAPRSRARMVARATTSAHDPGRCGFPGPEVLAELDPVDLQRTVGITGARARTVVTMARAVADGTLRLDPSPDVAGVRAGMLALPGVGPWTADLVALRRSCCAPRSWVRPTASSRC